ncbi:hypothetical protein GCM10010305_22450 [Streptomyces termitum]|uniref:Uncharacterized protein n=1 Tax=Streptomyces termitum TaxID=67368 RepID=A0A918T1T3_9ACTN|nr:hypothetical protein GCM10010305_22450 [Streptomyces termitum]
MRDRPELPHGDRFRELRESAARDSPTVPLHNAYTCPGRPITERGPAPGGRRDGIPTARKEPLRPDRPAWSGAVRRGPGQRSPARRRVRPAAAFSV